MQGQGGWEGEAIQDKKNIHPLTALSQVGSADWSIRGMREGSQTRPKEESEN